MALPVVSEIYVPDPSPNLVSYQRLSFSLPKLTSSALHPQISHKFLQAARNSAKGIAQLVVISQLSMRRDYIIN